MDIESLSQLEVKIMGLVAECSNGREHEYTDDNYSYVWAMDLASAGELPIETVRGVIGSLTKKGLVDTDPQEGLIGYTEEGAKFYDENYWDLRGEK